MQYVVTRGLHNDWVVARWGSFGALTIVSWHPTQREANSRMDELNAARSERQEPGEDIEASQDGDLNDADE